MAPAVHRFHTLPHLGRSCLAQREELLLQSGGTNNVKVFNSLRMNSRSILDYLLWKERERIGLVWWENSSFLLPRLLGPRCAATAGFPPKDLHLLQRLRGFSRTVHLCQEVPGAGDGVIGSRKSNTWGVEGERIVMHQKRVGFK